MRDEPDELTATERRLYAAFARGELLDLRGDNHDINHDINHVINDDINNATTDNPDLGPERVIRANVLAHLLLTGGDPAPVSPADAAPAPAPALRLAGARIEGQLRLDYAEIPYRITLRDCHFPDRVSLHSARTRNISLRDCTFVYLQATNADVDGDLRLCGCRFTGSHPTGMLRLDSAHINGVLDLERAQLVSTDPQHPALAANRIHVEDHIWLRSGFSCDGEIVLRGAQIGGDLDFSDARLRNPGRWALAASRMRVEGDIIGRGLHTEGEFRIPGTTVSGDVRLRSAQFRTPGGTALRAYGLDVAGGLQLSGGVRAEGRIALTNVRVGGVLDLNGALLYAPGGTALRMRQTQARETDLRTVQSPTGQVDLRHASLGVIRDDPAAWPTDQLLDGLRYDRFDVPLPARRRLDWLARDQSGYTPQSYEQLALAYRSLGHEDEARTVLLAKERARHRTLPWPARAWGALQDVTVGYGYRPTRAALWLLALLGLGSTVFAARPPTPDEPHTTLVFNSLVFTLDHLLPVISFGQGDAFTPTPGTQWLAYVLTATGWLLATTIATGISRSVSRT
ncbi:hypothetical protein OK074_9003 [Actinobacteria bacterium OK074]|nr:hypothetical protein OK074_9003 [Actinobacteria bacterium OK074]